MLEVYMENNGKYIIQYLDKKIGFSVFLCEKKFDTLKKELNYRSIKSGEPIALIPSSLVKTFLQFIYATLAYAIYSKIFKIRNQGLILVMFLIGEDQIIDTINILENEYGKADKYYILIIGSNRSKADLSTCKPYVYKDNPLLDLEVIVKNLDVLIKHL